MYVVEIKELELKLNKAKQQEQAVEHNKQINEKIKSFKDTRETIREKLSDLNDDIVLVNSEIKLAENSIQQILQEENVK